MAQTTPDAGSVRQQIEQQRDAPRPPTVRPPRVIPPPEIQPQPGVTISVKSFRFSGNTLLISEQLTQAVSDFVGRTLDFAGLQRATDAVAAAYREAGWIARVYLPEQDISEGTITLQVVEARFSGLKFEGDAPKLLSREEIAKWFSAHQAEGEPLKADALDRALLLTDDLPGVSLAGTLAPGQEDGETALVLQSTEEPFVFGDIGLDNTGSRSTGSMRTTLNININSPGGRGELASLNLLRTEGSQYARAALTAPLGYNGLRLGFSMSYLTYQVVEGPTANTASPIRGRSGSLGLDVNYPVLRSRLQNLYFSSGMENKTFLTQDTMVRSDYASNSFRLGMSGNRFDELWGGGANSGSLQVLWGQLTDMEAHSLINSIQRRYHKATFSLSRQQTLNAEHSLLFTTSGQMAKQVLDSSEKFYVGGAGSVRAYPSSELGGERGQVMSAEWRWRLNQEWTVSAFSDVGRVVMLPPTLSDQQNSYWLHGQGLSLGWLGPLGSMTKLTWAQRSGHNPKPTLTGTDSDGTLRINRVWLTTSLPI
jgi:hemolysin activation/secretion protein